MSGLKAAQVALNALRRCVAGMFGTDGREVPVGAGWLAGACRVGPTLLQPHACCLHSPDCLCCSQQEEEAAAEGAQEGKQMVAA